MRSNPHPDGGPHPDSSSHFHQGAERPTIRQSPTSRPHQAERRPTSMAHSHTKRRSGPHPDCGPHPDPEAQRPMSRQPCHWRLLPKVLPKSVAQKVLPKSCCRCDYSQNARSTYMKHPLFFGQHLLGRLWRKLLGNTLGNTFGQHPLYFGQHFWATHSGNLGNAFWQHTPFIWAALFGNTL